MLLLVEADEARTDVNAGGGEGLTGVGGYRKPIKLHLRRVRQRGPDVRVLRASVDPAVPLRQPPVPKPQGCAVPPGALSPPPEPHALDAPARVCVSAGGGVNGEGGLSSGGEAERAPPRHVVVRQALLVDRLVYVDSVNVVLGVVLLAL